MLISYAPPMSGQKGTFKKEAGRVSILKGLRQAFKGPRPTLEGYLQGWRVGVV